VLNAVCPGYQIAEKSFLAAVRVLEIFVLVYVQIKPETINGMHGSSIPAFRGAKLDACRKHRARRGSSQSQLSIPVNN
jgi:hypothetical protein